jgi:hypothetical protein
MLPVNPRRVRSLKSFSRSLEMNRRPPVYHHQRTPGQNVNRLGDDIMVTPNHTRKPLAARKPRLKAVTRPTPAPLFSTISTELRALLNELEHVRSTTVVAAALLDAQAADLDTDIAHLLRRSASDRLNAMIEKAAMVLAAVHAAELRKQVH